MRQYGAMLFAVVIGIAVSMIIEMVLSVVFPGLRGSAALHWTGNVVSIVVGLTVFNVVSARRIAK